MIKCKQCGYDKDSEVCHAYHNQGYNALRDILIEVRKLERRIEERLKSIEPLIR